MSSRMHEREQPQAQARPREPAVEEAFDRLVAEGGNRLARPLIPLLATGFVGGIDVGVGVLAYLVVEHDTGQPLLGAAAFPIGFVALLLARSELFTENFLVPVTARVAGRGSWLQLVRLWLVTLGANLVGGLVMAAMIVVAVPQLRLTAAQVGGHYAALGVSWRSLVLAVLAGIVITLLTRMQHASDELGPKLVAGIAMSFVLVAAQLFHSVLDSIFMFTGAARRAGVLLLGRLGAGPGLGRPGQPDRRHRPGDLPAAAAGTAPGRRRTRGAAVSGIGVRPAAGRVAQDIDETKGPSHGTFKHVRASRQPGAFHRGARQDAVRAGFRAHPR